MLQVRMFFTLGGASVADVGTNGAQLLGVAAAEAHQFRRRAANAGCEKTPPARFKP